jgi:hypothetical protein
MIAVSTIVESACRMPIAPPPRAVSSPATLPLLPRVKARRCTVSVGVPSSKLEGTERIRVVPPTSSVTTPLPSSTVSYVTSFDGAIGIETGAAPQPKAITPPTASAFAKAVSVQLASVPVSTKASGLPVLPSALGPCRLPRAPDLRRRFPTPRSPAVEIERAARWPVSGS